MAEREATTPRARDSVAVGKENNVDDDDVDVDAVEEEDARSEEGIVGEQQKRDDIFLWKVLEFSLY